MSPKLKIGLLVAGHIVAGLILGWVVYEGNLWPESTYRGLQALVFAEAGLLGIWGGLGTTPLSRRLPAVLVTTAYLSAVDVIALHIWYRWTFLGKDGWIVDAVQSILYFVLIVLPILVILLVLSGLRHGRRRLRVECSNAWSSASERFQFTIRHLLLTTAVVAIVLAIGRVVPGLADDEWDDILFVAILIPCLTLVDLATLWAALGIGRPTPRLALVVPTAFVVGAIPIYILEGIALWTFSAQWSAIVGLQAIIMACSLLIVRSCGWRLVSGTAEKSLAGGGTNAVADEERAVSKPLPTPPGS